MVALGGLHPLPLACQIAARERAAELKIANAKAKERKALRAKEEWERDQEALRWMAIKAEKERCVVFACVCEHARW